MSETIERDGWWVDPNNEARPISSRRPHVWTYEDEIIFGDNGLRIPRWVLEALLGKPRTLKDAILEAGEKELRWLCEALDVDFDQLASRAKRVVAQALEAAEPRSAEEEHRA